MEAILSIKGLEKKYRDFYLGPVHLDIPSGSIVGFIGENGAGKSTLIKALVGLVKPDAGEVFFQGARLSPNDRDSFEKIGLGLDELNMPKEMTIRQIGNFCQRFFRDWDPKLFDDYLRRFSLSEDKKMKELSRGMRMKLSLTTALSHRPRLLILDEATSGLDPIIREEILDILLEFIQDERNSVFISSHILSDLEKIADYIAFIHQGKMLFMEEKDVLRDEYALFSPQEDEKDQVDPEAIVAVRKNNYGQTWLVYRERMPSHVQLDRPSIEEIMLFYLKGEKK